MANYAVKGTEYSISELVTALREGYGCAVVCFQASDMEGYGDPAMGFQERLDRVYEAVEERLVEHGWEVIDAVLGSNSEGVEDDDA